MAAMFKDLKGAEVECRDGTTCKITDVLFSDHTGRIEYFVLQQGGLLPERPVLIEPEDLEFADEMGAAIYSELTKAKLDDAPTIEQNPPVSMQAEIMTKSCETWIPYCPTIGYGSDIPFLYPASPSVRPARQARMWRSELHRYWDQFDHHLRSAAALCGYRIQSQDHRRCGIVEDLLFDLGTLTLEDILVLTRRWMPGGEEFVMAPTHVRSFDDEHHRLNVDVSKEAFLKLPHFRPELAMEQNASPV